MASYQRYRNEDGSTSIVAQVRIKPFKPIAKSFTTKPAAKEWADAKERELKSQRERGADRSDLPSLTIKTLIDEYLADADIKVLRTFDDTERLLSWWIDNYGSNRAAELGALKLRVARQQIQTSGDRGDRGPATTNRYLSAMRGAWNWGRAAGLIPTERVWPTRLFLSEPRERVRFLDDTELASVMAAAEKHAPWMYAALLVSLATGLRQGELLRLNWADVDFEKKTVTVHISKNTKRRLVHLPDPAIAALKKLRRDGIVGPKWIFSDGAGAQATKSHLRIHWLIVREAAGLIDFKWHDLRHSCASFLAQNGASLVEIGSVLGHSSPSITAKYSHLVAGKAVTGADKLAEKLSAKP
jgi:integrase